MDSLCFVLSVNPYSFIDPRTNSKVEGISIEYLMTDSLNPNVNEDGSLGYKSTKQSLPISKFEKVKSVPAYYNLTYKLEPRAKGGPQMKLHDIDFISELVTHENLQKAKKVPLEV